MFKRSLPVCSIFIPKIFNDIGVNVIEVIVIKSAISRTDRVNKRFKKHSIEFLSIVFIKYT